jgi:hypothetical protein
MIPQATLTRASIYHNKRILNVKILSYDEIWTTKPYCGCTNGIPLTDEVVRMPNILRLFRHKGDTPENVPLMFITFINTLTLNCKKHGTLVTLTLLHLCQHFC